MKLTMLVLMVYKKEPIQTMSSCKHLILLMHHRTFFITGGSYIKVILEHLWQRNWFFFLILKNYFCQVFCTNFFYARLKCRNYHNRGRKQNLCKFILTQRVPLVLRENVTDLKRSTRDHLIGLSFLTCHINLETGHTFMACRGSSWSEHVKK